MELWVGIFTFAAVLFVVIGVDAVRRGKSVLLAQRLGTADRITTLEWQLDQRDEPFQRQIMRQFQRLAVRVAPAGILADTARRLRWAGMNDMKAEEFYAIRLAAAIIAAGATLALSVVGMGASGITLTLVAGALGYLIPDRWLTGRVRARQAAAERQLLPMVDMLAVATEAGLPLGEAIQQVADQIGGVLGAEFRRADDEMRLGATRAVALAGVADRVGLDDLTNVIAAITEAERTGTPVAAVLRQQAAAIRQSRQLRAQEVAQKMSVRIMLPVMVCIFLPMMIVILGPAFINLAQALGM